MEGDSTVLHFIFLILFFLASTFFSVIKIIFSSTDKDSLPVDNERLRYLTLKIENIVENRVYFSTLVSFGKTISNTGFAIFSFYITDTIFQELSFYQIFGCSLSFSVIVLSLFAYTLPRAFAWCFPQNFLTVSYWLYQISNIFIFVFAKTFMSLHQFILRLFNYDIKLAFLSDKEKSKLVDNSESEEGLDENEKEMIRSIFELGETTVKKIMVPRIDIKALNINTDYHTALRTIREAGHSRIPVYKKDIDSIVGILYAKDILSWISEEPDTKPDKRWNLKSIMKTPLFVVNNKKIDDLMSELKKNQIHMAIVVDEYGGTAGIVTMEDILEEIVGEIQDEYDVEEEPVKKIAANVYHVKPHIELDDLMEKIDISLNLDGEKYNTLSGLFYHEYGDVPKENTEFEFNGLRLKILKMDNQRIVKVELEVLRDKPVDLKKAF